MQPLAVSSVRLLYTVKEKRGKPDRKSHPLPYGLRNPYRNLKSETLETMPRDLNEIVRSRILNKNKRNLIKTRGTHPLLHTVNVDCVKFEYVVLAKYHHMLIFEFDLLTKQQILILCKKLL